MRFGLRWMAPLGSGMAGGGGVCVGAPMPPLKPLVLTELFKINEQN